MYLTCKLPNADTSLSKPDFTILYNNDSYPIPKLNAMLSSPFISKKLRENPTYSSIVLHGNFTKENIVLLTDYIWGKEIKITPANAEEMIYLGIEIECTSIIECSNIMYEAMSTITEIIFYLSKAPMNTFCSFAAKYIHYFIIIEKFSDLPHETINKILSQQFLGLRTGQAIIDWLLFYQDKQESKYKIPKSETFYLFRNVSLNFISDNVKRQHFIINHPEAAKEMKSDTVPYIRLSFGDEEGFKKHLSTMITDYTRQIF